MRAHAFGFSLRRPRSPRCKILSRQLDANVARGRDHVRLYVFPRSPSSRPNFDAGPPTRLPRPPQNSRRLALGKTLETSRPHHPPALTCGTAILGCALGVFLFSAYSALSALSFPAASSNTRSKANPLQPPEAQTPPSVSAPRAASVHRAVPPSDAPEPRQAKKPTS